VFLCKLLSVIEKQFFSDHDISQGNELDSMLTVHKEDLSFAVETVLFVVRVVYEASFISEARGVDTPFAVQIEQK
jgi:hypothetical protein